MFTVLSLFRFPVISTHDAIVTVLLLGFLGFCLYLFLTYVPMKAPFPQLIVAFVVFVLILWLLSKFNF